MRAAEDLRDEPPFRDAYGTSPYGTRNKGTEAVTGRASLYGTGRRGLRDELLTGRDGRSGSFVVLLYEVIMAQRGLLYFMGRWDLRDESPYGTEGLTGRISLPSLLRDSLITGRRRLRDESPFRTFNYGAEGLTGHASLGAEALTRRAYGTSLLTGLVLNYGTGALTGRASLRDSYNYTGRGSYAKEALTGRALRDS